MIWLTVLLLRMDQFCLSGSAPTARLSMRRSLLRWPWWKLCKRSWWATLCRTWWGGGHLNFHLKRPTSNSSAWIPVFVILQVCTKCKGVKEANMPLYCTCAGNYDLTFSTKVCNRCISIDVPPVRLNVCANDWFLSLLASTELLWADHSISEHRNSLQHEISGRDYRLVARHESTN